MLNRVRVNVRARSLATQRVFPSPSSRFFIRKFWRSSSLALAACSFRSPRGFSVLVRVYHTNCQPVGNCFVKIANNASANIRTEQMKYTKLQTPNTQNSDEERVREHERITRNVTVIWPFLKTRNSYSQNQWLFTKHLIKQMTLTSLLCPFLSALLAYKIYKHLHHLFNAQWQSTNVTANAGAVGAGGGGGGGGSATAVSLLLLLVLCLFGSMVLCFWCFLVGLFAVPMVMHAKTASCFIAKGRSREIISW